MNNSKTIPAEIHATLAIGSPAAAPYYDVNIVQRLCGQACADETPVFVPVFSVLSHEEVGASKWLVNLHVEGVIHYIPCGCGSCSTKQQIVSQDFSIPVFSATGISGVTVSADPSFNYVSKVCCKDCSTTFVSNTPITLTITTA